MARLIDADNLIEMLEKKAETSLDELIVLVLKGAVDIMPTEDVTNVVKHGDLISRSELIENIKNPPVHCSLGGITIEDVLTMIDEQPTVYNVDEVSKEVYEITGRIFNYCEEIDYNIPESERTGYKMLPDILRVRKVVREGFVSGK